MVTDDADSSFHFAFATSPCTGCFSPRYGVVFPPNGMQKKPPRSPLMIAGLPFDSFPVAHGATENGAIFRPPILNVTGPTCPPVSVTKASTSLVAMRQDG